MHQILILLAANPAASGNDSHGNTYNFITALVLAVLAAIVGGLVATWLKQPLLIGYLLGGLIIGPYTPGPVGDLNTVQVLAEIGVALLMFALGTEFSIGELKHVGKSAVISGLVQLGLIIALGIPVGALLGLNVSSGLFLGGLLAISSSIVMLKLLLARGELDSRHGKLAIAVGVVQDLSLIVLVVVLPSLGQAGDLGELAGKIGVALLKAGLFLGGAYIFGTRFFPWLLAQVIRLGIRELFLLVVISIALGMAILAQALDISFALGAFVAGLVISEAEAASEVLNEIVPIRDIFASLFFVSVGMLIDPAFVVGHLPQILLLVSVALGAKWLILTSLFKLLGQPTGTALLAGLLLAQVGEFSFVLAQIGVSTNAIPGEIEKLILAAALVTIIANPLLLQAYSALAKRRASSKIEQPSEVATESEEGTTLVSELPHLEKHVIVGGYGRVGRELVAECRQRGYQVVVIEYDQHKLDQARKDGLTGIYGDVAVEATLKRANIGQARVLALAIPDLVVVEAATRLGRHLNPELEILTRATGPRSVQLLKEAGASVIIQPEFEAGLEFIRQTAKAYGVGGVELAGITNNRRLNYYG